ncbi:unnamed protein product [Macrosiphum euphorbiae]|uniref:Uncharacterized protein n=1 Tax=Macrosiphum euphorbiae TaxID=13131 RepID=A0AAV0W906_9HEMI|nr:unnamed protein product [Macrosiphum euphorbiae]
MYALDVPEDGNVTSALDIKKGKYGKPHIKRTMYIHDFKKDSNVPCSLPRAAGIKRKRVQTDAGASTFKKESMKNFPFRVQRINAMLRKTVMSLLNSRRPLPNTSSN